MFEHFRLCDCTCRLINQNDGLTRLAWHGDRKWVCSDDRLCPSRWRNRGRGIGKPNSYQTCLCKAVGVIPQHTTVIAVVDCQSGNSQFLGKRDELSETLINCASQEYFGAVDLKALMMTVVTPQFMELKDGKAKIVSFFAKKARGAMARYIVQNRLTRPNEILEFDTGGYAYTPEMSEPGKPVFLRDYPTP